MSDMISVQRAISELPAGPEWVRLAGLAAIADCIDYTDSEQVAAVVGRSVTAEEMEAVVDKCDAGIRHTSEVLRSLGLLAWQSPIQAGSNPIRTLTGRSGTGEEVVALLRQGFTPEEVASSVFYRKKLYDLAWNRHLDLRRQIRTATEEEKGPLIAEASALGREWGFDSPAMWTK